MLTQYRPTFNLYSSNFNKLQTYLVTTAVDTEYVQQLGYPNKMITTQVAFSETEAAVLEHPSLGLGILPTWNGQCILSELLGVPETVAERDAYLVWEVLMFFAPADLLAGLFRDREMQLYIQRNCKQDARITIDTGSKKNRNLLPTGIKLDTDKGVLEIVLKVLDLAKLGQGGLVQIAESFGVPMEDKGLMDEYKTNMLEAYTNPQLLPTYLKYGISDATVLFKLRKANLERTEQLFAAHNLPVPENEIVTTGALVASLFQAYIQQKLEEHPFYEEFKVTNTKGKVVAWELEDILKRGTVAYWAVKEETRKAALALVQGGRAKNERPTVIKVGGLIADVDAASFYVAIQRTLTYPVGLPCTYGRHESSNGKKMELGKFLSTYGDELEKRLWVAVVSGSLDQTQTLVASKVCDNFHISEKWNEEDPNIPADFRLYTHEVINGIITSDVLETLKNVCSTKEYAEWMRLEVVTAAWYPKSLRCNSAEEILEKTREHAERTGNSIEEEVDKKGQIIIQDNRSRYWYAVSLDDFLAPYADKRKVLKSLMKQEPKGSDKYRQLDAQQNAMKLVGNTLYGVLASPYFVVGNVVVANNITAAARTAIWLTGTALGCYQLITDGGSYDLNAVRTWTGIKPTMTTLSLLRDRQLLSKRQRQDNSTKPLGGREWSLVASEKVVSQEGGADLYTTISNGEEEYRAKEQTWTRLDELALQHVREYFKKDGATISILYDIAFEHKDVYIEAIFHSQTNYRFQHATGEYKTKARGWKLKGSPYEDDEEANIHELFEDLAVRPNAIPPYKPQVISQILKMNQANEMLGSAVPADECVFKRNLLVAGDTVPKRSHLRPISLSMFHWQDDAQFQSWSKASDKLKARTGYGVEQFYLNQDGSLRYADAVVDIQQKIDDGAEFVVPLVKGQGSDKIFISPHPFFEVTGTYF